MTHFVWSWMQNSGTCQSDNKQWVLWWLLYQKFLTESAGECFESQTLFGLLVRICRLATTALEWFWFKWITVCGMYAISALTLLVGRQEEHPACKNWLLTCWCGCLSGARCRLLACGPADATAIPKPHYLLPHLNPDWFYLSGTSLPRLSWIRGH